VAGNGVPASFLDVYRARELAALILAGPLIAVAGAILPASRAARSRTSAALHAE
jgi:putative ABC transport system permease protein